MKQIGNFQITALLLKSLLILMILTNISNAALKLSLEELQRRSTLPANTDIILKIEKETQLSTPKVFMSKKLGEEFFERAVILNKDGLQWESTLGNFTKSDVVRIRVELTSGLDDNLKTIFVSKLKNVMGGIADILSKLPSSLGETALMEMIMAKAFQLDIEELKNVYMEDTKTKLSESITEYFTDRIVSLDQIRQDLENNLSILKFNLPEDTLLLDEVHDAIISDLRNNIWQFKFKTLNFPDQDTIHDNILSLINNSNITPKPDLSIDAQKTYIKDYSDEITRHLAKENVALQKLINQLEVRNIKTHSTISTGHNVEEMENWIHTGIGVIGLIGRDDHPSELSGVFDVGFSLKSVSKTHQYDDFRDPLQRIRIHVGIKIFDIDAGTISQSWFYVAPGYHFSKYVSVQMGVGVYKKDNKIVNGFVLGLSADLLAGKYILQKLGEAVGMVSSE